MKYIKLGWVFNGGSSFETLEGTVGFATTEACPTWVLQAVDDLVGLVVGDGILSLLSLITIIIHHYYYIIICNYIESNRDMMFIFIIRAQVSCLFIIYRQSANGSTLAQN